MHDPRLIASLLLIVLVAILIMVSLIQIAVSARLMHRIGVHVHVIREAIFLSTVTIKTTEDGTVPLNWFHDAGTRVRSHSL